MKKYHIRIINFIISAGDLSFDTQYHPTEKSWTHFREYMNAQLPHIWRNRYSTRFSLAHFEKQRMGKKTNSWHKKEKPLGDHYLSGIYSLGKNVKLPHFESEHDIIPNVLVAHLRDGIEVLHFWSGRIININCRSFNSYYITIRSIIY